MIDDDASPYGGSAIAQVRDEVKYQTVVFRFDNPEQRKQLFDLIRPYMDAEQGLRVTALAIGNDVARVFTADDVVGHYRDIDDLKDALQSLLNTTTPETWTIEAYEAAQYE